MEWGSHGIYYAGGRRETVEAVNFASRLKFLVRYLICDTECPLCCPVAFRSPAAVKSFTKVKFVD